MDDAQHAPTPDGDDEQADGVTLLDLLVPLAEGWKLWILGSLAVGLAALGLAFWMTPVFTARTSFLPPQQQQSSLASALNSLGGLAGLAGAAATGLKSPADQFVALMQSVTAQDRLIDRFDLLKVYEVKFRFEARRVLDGSTRLAVGKKDGLISVEVDDIDPQRAADVANAYVEELRRMLSVLAVSEAQLRRVFFEKELKEARDQLANAQRALQSSGFNVGDLRAEPKAAADTYASLKAELTAAEVRLQVLRGSMADSSAEVKQQLVRLGALRAQVARLEQATDSNAGPDYVSKYREFKYRETLFDLFARQYEIARVDEAREGALIQVVDPATPPEHKSKPKRALIAIASTIVALLLLGMYILIRSSWRESDSQRAVQLGRLRAALRLH